MELPESTDQVTGFIASFKCLSKPIKQAFIALSVFSLATLSFGVFSYVELNRSMNDQQEYMDLMSSEISSIEFDLSDAQQEIDWLKQTVDAVIDRVDTVCDFLRGYTWC